MERESCYFIYIEQNEYKKQISFFTKHFIDHNYKNNILK